MRGIIIFINSRLISCLFNHFIIYNPLIKPGKHHNMIITLSHFMLSIAIIMEIIGKKQGNTDCSIALYYFQKRGNSNQD